MKRLTLIAFVATFFMVGCTSPETKVAMTAVDTQNRQYESIQDDLVTLSAQQELDKAIANLDAGIDPKEVVTKLANGLNKIHWLNEEWTKTRYGPGGLVLYYIHAQKGALSEFLADVDEANKATPSPE